MWSARAGHAAATSSKRTDRIARFSLRRAGYARNARALVLEERQDRIAQLCAWTQKAKML